MKNHRSEKSGKKSIRRIIHLGVGEECIGMYESLRIATDRIGVVLSLNNSESVEISLPLNLTKEKTLREKFRSLKIGDKISILKIADAKTPFLIRKLRDGKNTTGQKLGTRSRRTQR